MAVDGSEAILLTGAGFTHNFGGYLANDIWAEIFNHPLVQQDSSLRKSMVGHTGSGLDFEVIYDQILNDRNRSADSKSAFAAAVAAAFENLDAIVRRLPLEAQLGFSINALGKFIDRFAGSSSRPGYFFTVNQDLLVESGVLALEKLVALPGLPSAGRFTRQFQTQDLKTAELKLPAADALPEGPQDLPTNGAHLLYVKLHGSTEWRGNDGVSRPVIGTQKAKIVADQKLLRLYGDLFKIALADRPNRQLVVIGYSFRDRNINDVIATACRNAGLKVYIVTLDQPDAVRDRLSTTGGQAIVDAMVGFYRRPFTELFTRTGVGPGRIAHDRLVRSVFETV